MKFFSVEPNRQHFISDPNLFGQAVATAFPSTSVDIEEAAKCIAFERWTAAVFYLSRVSEIATVLIGKKAEYNDPKPSLSGVLNYIDGQLEKARKNRKEASNVLVGEIEFFANLSAQMHAVNQAWRQHVAHLDTKYTEEEALRIWDATKGLLQAMSVKVQEPIK